MSSQSVSGPFDINSLFEEAQTRWLKPAEVLFILQNHDKYQLTHEPPQRPTSGSLYLFNKRVLRFFRRDGHSWRKKRDGRTVGEAHERLKVGNTETLNCYYAHGEDNPNFQRRSYWMLDPAFDHIVLVHYREITEGKPSPRSFAQLSPVSPSAFSPSSGSVEVNSGVEENGVDSKPEYAGSGGNDVSQVLRRLEEQLSLNDDSIREIGPFYGHEESGNASDILFQDKPQSFGQEQATPEGSQFYSEIMGTQQQKNDLLQLQESGDTGSYNQSYSDCYSSANKESLSWNELMESIEAPLVVEKQGKAPYSLNKEPFQENQHFDWPDGSASGVGSCYDSVMKTPEANSVYYSAIYDQGHLDNPLGVSSNLTVGVQQKFSIREISPEWGYATDTTKVIIVGSFLCDPSQSSWKCMFGEAEVALEIIQDGVVCCAAPPHLPGKVSLCITSSNRVSCSEVREFEYREKASCRNCSSSLLEVAKSPEELLLLVRCIQMLLSDSAIQQWDTMNTGSDVSRNLTADDDLWSQVIESLLIGGGTTSGTMDWLLEQLIKDKLQEWLSSKGGHEEDGCSLSKKEQGIIHMIAGLGFEWALNPILSCGVNINFRDINGWTALHWAARFGREKMVAGLLASGASPVAVTDPNQHDPIGRTPAFIADNYGHKGLAGYLSEVGLTSHLSSLKLAESELSKGSAEIQAEQTIDCIPMGKLSANDDAVSMKDTLAAVRNAAQAAARIQSAFRAHSFRRRRESVVGAASSTDEYGIKDSDIEGLSALSKMTFGHAREHTSAALSIQKKYRGWKGRKDFLALRQKVVKIQAHVRGYQVRKNKRVCWAVGILDKVVLRWRRKGVGLRGFRNDMDCIDEAEEEDILRVFRHQKVDKAIDEAVSRVLSMVDSVEARQQYQRMLLKYRQAKEALGTATNIAALSPISEVSDMENESSYHF